MDSSSSSPVASSIRSNSPGLPHDQVNNANPEPLPTARHSLTSRLVPATCLTSNSFEDTPDRALIDNPRPSVRSMRSLMDPAYTFQTPKPRPLKYLSRQLSPTPTCTFDWVPSIPATHPDATTPSSASQSGDISEKSSRAQASPYLNVSTVSSKFTSNHHSFKSTSASSLLYYVRKPPMNRQLPFFEDSEPAAVQEFMDQAQKCKLKDHNTYPFIFMAFWYLLLAAIAYFLFVGYPLWPGLVITIWKFVHDHFAFRFGFLVFMVWGGLISWIPLLFADFEQNVDNPETRDASETCLIIPAYKAAGALPETISHALKIFNPKQIFIIANGNSPTPLDNTEEVCQSFGVNYAWVPVGSKITAEFIGVSLGRKYKYAMLIDDDVHLPANLPLVTHRMNDKTKCIGYSIRSTGPYGSKGTWVQQAQDIEYKLSGMSKVFQNKYGSVVFPHGAIILWDRDVLEKLFWAHPGFPISEDWYFGHTCRSSGYRIQFCSQVFVETETPPSLFIPVKSTRGGYGEMTVWRQRFYRWNFFFLYRLKDNIQYLLFSWRLGWYEIITKLYVLVEMYNSSMCLIRPFMLPLTFVASPKLTGMLTAILLGAYVLACCVFNAWHLRRKGQSVAWKIIPFYFGFKLALAIVNTVSVYYSLYAYARYFSVPHPRVVENYQALEAARQCIANAKAQLSGGRDDASSVSAEPAVQASVLSTPHEKR